MKTLSRLHPVNMVIAAYNDEGHFSWENRMYMIGVTRTFAFTYFIS